MTPRSWLYVPGHRPDRIGKALTSGAEAVVIDLEDAVPDEAKATARACAAAALAAATPVPVFVRINAVGSAWAEADVKAVAGPGLAGLRVPKVETADQVREVVSWLVALGHPAVVHCLLESARGVEAAMAIATAHRRVTGISLGEADLRADLGIPLDEAGDEGLAYARSRIVVAARAAGLDPPVQSVHTGDDASLRASCERGRALGFWGRSAIHPRQLRTIHEVYRLNAVDVEAARAIVAAMAAAETNGAGSLRLPDGRFIDRAVAESARRVLAAADHDEREHTSSTAERGGRLDRGSPLRAQCVEDGE